jgi:phenol hydroxylase P5 protein
MKPEQLKATVTSSRFLAANRYLEIVLKPEKALEHHAGQYLSLKINETGERRSYSLASWPGQENLELMADISPGGKGSQYLLNLKPGHEVEILYPLGRFTVEDTLGGELSADRKLLFIGTGSGIVPLRSMVHSLLEKKGVKVPIRLHWGMRFTEDLFWVDEFKDLENRFPNFKMDVVLSKAGEGWIGCRGHVNDCLTSHQDSWSGWSAYLCGNQKMIVGVNKLLLEKGVGQNQVFFEQFY